jgi:hypothetical protein
MKNTYEIIDGDIKIKLNRRKEEPMYTYILTSQLEKLINFNTTWYAAWNRPTKSYYARCTEYLGTFDGKPKYKITPLHTYLMGLSAGNEFDVNHLDHDTLNNRRTNLELLTRLENSKYRVGANRNSKTGVRNVSFRESDGKYVVQLQVERKNTIIGSFDNIQEAEECAITSRERIYGNKYK